MFENDVGSAWCQRATHSVSNGLAMTCEQYGQFECKVSRNRRETHENGSPFLGVRAMPRTPATDTRHGFPTLAVGRAFCIAELSSLLDGHSSSLRLISPDSEATVLSLTFNLR